MPQKKWTNSKDEGIQNQRSNNNLYIRYQTRLGKDRLSDADAQLTLTRASPFIILGSPPWSSHTSVGSQTGARVEPFHLQPNRVKLGDTFCNHNTIMCSLFGLD